MSGAYTGEVSPAMLQGWCQWVLVGHSERRAYLGETDEMVAKKAAAALACDLSVIMCVGELDEHYVAGTRRRGGQRPGQGRARQLLRRRFLAAGHRLRADLGDRHRQERRPRARVQDDAADPARSVGEMIGAGAARKVRVLYGGSVNAANVESYVELPLCDGCLVGGASLKAEEFSEIVKVTAAVYGHR